MKILITIIALVLIIGLGFVFLIKNPSDSPTGTGITGTSYKAVMGTITLQQDFPENQATVPLYRVTQQENDILEVYLQQVERTRPSVISEKDAPAAAEKILENYGGIPTDAVLRSSETSYVKRFNRTTKQEEKVSPV